MKYSTALLAVAATTVAAVPSNSKRSQCTFGTYACLTDDSGIQICDIEGNWELVGPCPSGTSCEYLPQNGFDLPFCTSNPTTTATPTPTPLNGKAKAKRGADGGANYNWCPTPGTYTCDGWNAIQVCNTTNGLEKVGNCPSGSHCSYINNIPYCVE
ncbi:hypothetical protein SPBR_08741 [Sporothrix brasiliensis 5110]|uniref:Carbohydrate-binding module family 19 domain-containing protein n=1 Tax=Sporothrix brasiliensis 5110 TaxID=1398154 RepID=A0A0C2IHC3_9PEZI|nr:uncharacterized protein SPBR_08741 [Sporothrix brasiliensis 5110]KIH86425.1 hypothetical protein SPBR_08741 [Sporothrix brasiliensis 5110]